MTPLRGTVVLHQDASELARAGAAEMLRLAREAVATRGAFSVALTGGSSPGDLYGLLAEPAIAGEMPWEHVHLFWGDDRVFPPRHPRSNFRLAQDLFIGRVPIPVGNVHRVRGEEGAERAAANYERELTEFFGGFPRFDLVHLGLGEDGHVASLFPFDREALLDRSRIARPALFRPLGEWRVTLTYPVLNAARRLEFLLPDPAKAGIARTAMRGPLDPVRIPAQGIHPRDGELLWRVARGVVGL